jgi:hypothetical protein
MPSAHNCSAQTDVEAGRPAHYLKPRRGWRRFEETKAVKYLLSAAALAGSLGMWLSDWAGQAFPYL